MFEDYVKMQDAERATFQQLEGRILTVETDEYEYEFDLNDQQLEQCYRHLATQEELIFTVNAEKGIIFFDTEYSIQEKSQFDNLVDFYLATLEQPSATELVSIDKLYEIDGRKYAEITRENGTETNIYLGEEKHDLILDTLESVVEQGEDIEDVYFSYSPQMYTIVFNDNQGLGEGDIKLGNQLMGTDGDD